LGGSKTSDNLADADALGIDPSIVGYILHGNYGGAVRWLIHAGSNAVTGNTPKVRPAVAICSCATEQVRPILIGLFQH
jgi:hypothetical protein